MTSRIQEWEPRNGKASLGGVGGVFSFPTTETGPSSLKIKLNIALGKSNVRMNPFALELFHSTFQSIYKLKKRKKKVPSNVTFACIIQY